MQTHFSPSQLTNPQVAESDRILRKCVHCGFCTATCPTYLLTGDELDGPRGRIYLAKDMLEKDRPADPTTVKHLDRCLTCLSCMTTCPSGVHYMHLIDHARQHIERTYRRPLGERLLRAMLAFVLPNTTLFRASLWVAALASPFRALLPERVRGLIEMARATRAARAARATAARPDASTAPNSRGSLGTSAALGSSAAFGTSAASGTGASPDTGAAHDIGNARATPDTGAPSHEQRHAAAVPGDKPDQRPTAATRTRRIALLPGCVQPALRPEINDAAIRLLARHGVEVIIAKGTGCCGALVHHLGREHDSHAQAKADIDAWTREIESNGLDAIIVTASGCGTMLKDYGFLFRNDPEYAAKAARVASLARDITEELAHLDLTTSALPPTAGTHRVAYHSACSLQHGQKLHSLGPDLLRKAGFNVVDIPEGHICCGSAGTYSLLQPEMSTKLRDRKARNIESVAPTVIAAGNIGCMTQIAQGTAIPIVHTVELLDWATGGPQPAGVR